jgi:hypothetical protein
MQILLTKLLIFLLHIGSLASVISDSIQFCFCFDYFFFINMISRHAALKLIPSVCSRGVRSFSANVFPRQREGNDYDVNFSLLEDGVTSTGDSFRNARTSLLTSRLSVKPANGTFAVTSPKLLGEYKLVESGDSITHDAFEALKASQEEVLSSGLELFVEDAGLGAATQSRVGARVVTQNAATALAFRKLLVSFCF